MPSDFDLPEDLYPHVVQQLMEKSWAELEVLEHAGYLLFPDEIYRRMRDGTFERKKVRLRLPRTNERRAARVQARAWAEEDKLDPELDKDLIDELETLCLLSVAIRDATPPHSPFEPDPKVLERTWDKPSLVQVWRKLDALYHVVDPAPDKISEGEMLALMAKLSKERHLGPLAAYGSAAQTTFVVTMADRLLSSLASR